jgi:hypothetical protein
MMNMRVIVYDLTYDIKDSGMPVREYTNLTSWINNHSPNQAKKLTPATAVLLLHNDKS